MLIDIGHVGQNAMLSASALGLGSCCLAAFDSAKCDQALEVDGTDEYTVYVVTVGQVKG
jgi:nitroreductase